MLRFLTSGESHGPLLTAIVDGIPAGLPLCEDDLNVDMARRQQGYGRGGRMSIEKDRARITGGVMAGLTTGGPVGLLVENRDWQNWREKDIPPFTVPRPGHADLTGAIKYGYTDLRLSLERASARETAARGAVGSICRKLLAEFGITVGGYVTMIGGVVASLPPDLDDAGTSPVLKPPKPAMCAALTRSQRKLCMPASTRRSRIRTRWAASSRLWRSACRRGWAATCSPTGGSTRACWARWAPSRRSRARRSARRSPRRRNRGPKSTTRSRSSRMVRSTGPATARAGWKAVSRPARRWSCAAR